MKCVFCGCKDNKVVDSRYLKDTAIRRRRECINCGECDRCDLDPNKICDSCGKCIECDKNYKIIKITKSEANKSISFTNGHAT